jgi:hypothetical protein
MARADEALLLSTASGGFVALRPSGECRRPFQFETDMQCSDTRDCKSASRPGTSSAVCWIRLNVTCRASANSPVTSEDRGVRARISATPRGDLVKWVAEGGDFRDAAQSIRKARFGEEAGSRLPGIFAMLGALMLAASVSAFMAANWQEIPRLARLVGILTVIAGCFFLPCNWSGAACRTAPTRRSHSPRFAL